MLKIKDNVDLKELEKFGFENGSLCRYIDGRLVYMIVITSTHHYIQIRTYDPSIIAKSLQEKLFDLIQASLVEKEEELENEKED